MYSQKCAIITKFDYTESIEIGMWVQTSISPTTGHVNFCFLKMLLWKAVHTWCEREQFISPHEGQIDKYRVSPLDFDSDLYAVNSYDLYSSWMWGACAFLHLFGESLKRQWTVSCLGLFADSDVIGINKVLMRGMDVLLF